MTKNRAIEPADGAVRRSRSLFLTKKEVVDLTGYTQPKRQAAQLLRMGIRFFIKAGGHPVVTRVAVEGRPKPVAEGPRPTKSQELNWDT
jgi:hypothetical protein